MGDYRDVYKEHGTREEDLQGMLISVIVGAIIAAGLCAVLPGINTGRDMLECFVGFWVMALISVWAVIDTLDRKRKMP